MVSLKGSRRSLNNENNTEESTESSNPNSNNTDGKESQSGIYLKLFGFIVYLFLLIMYTRTKTTKRTTSFFFFLASILIIVLSYDNVNNKSNAICTWDKEFKEATKCKYYKMKDSSETTHYTLIAMSFFIAIASLYKIYMFKSWGKQNMWNGKGILGKVEEYKKGTQ